MQINEHFCAKYKQNLHISKKSAKKFARAYIYEIKVVLLHQIYMLTLSCYLVLNMVEKDNYIQVCTDFHYSTRVHIKGQRVRIAENRDIPFI